MNLDEFTSPLPKPWLTIKCESVECKDLTAGTINGNIFVGSATFDDVVVNNSLEVAGYTLPTTLPVQNNMVLSCSMAGNCDWQIDSGGTVPDPLTIGKLTLTGATGTPGLAILNTAGAEISGDLELADTCLCDKYDALTQDSGLRYGLDSAELHVDSTKRLEATPAKSSIYSPDTLHEITARDAYIGMVYDAGSQIHLDGSMSYTQVGGAIRELINGSQSQLCGPDLTKCFYTDNATSRITHNSVNRFNADSTSTFINSQSNQTRATVSDAEFSVIVGSLSRIQANATDTKLIHLSSGSFNMNSDGASIYFGSNNRFSTSTATNSTQISSPNGLNFISLSDNLGGQNLISSNSVSRIMNAGSDTVTFDALNRVGIGTTTPSARLHLVGSLRIQDGNEAAGRVLTSDTDGVASWSAPSAPGYIISPNGLTRIDAADSSIIGKVAANDRITLDGTRSRLLSPNGAAYLDVDNSALLFTYSTIPRFIIDANSSTLYTPSSTGYVQLSNSGLSMLTSTAPASGGVSLNLTDNLGINMSYFGSRVFDTTSAGTVVTGGRLNSSYLTLYSNASGVAGVSDYVSIATSGGTERLRVLTNGNIGIGTSAPSTRLHIVGGLRLQDGNEAVGRVLISDASGVGTWTTSPYALTSGKLNQFAATTSAELSGVISDETGSGSLVFATSPTLVTPNIGAAVTSGLDTAAATSLSIGGTNCTTLNLGRVGQVVALRGQNCTMAGYPLIHGVFTCYDTTSVSGTTTETSLMGALTGSNVLPANSISTGQHYRIIVGGRWSIDSVLPASLSISLRGGTGSATTGTLLATTGNMAGLLTGANQPFFIEFNLWSTSAGAGKCTTTVSVGNTSYGSNYQYFDTNSLTQNVSNTLVVTAKFGSIDAGNSITREVMSCTHLY